MGGVSADGKVLWLSGRYYARGLRDRHRRRAPARADPGRRTARTGCACGRSPGATRSGTRGSSDSRPRGFHRPKAVPPGHRGAAGDRGRARRRVPRGRARDHRRLHRGRRLLRDLGLPDHGPAPATSSRRTGSISLRRVLRPPRPAAAAGGGPRAGRHRRGHGSSFTPPVVRPAVASTRSPRRSTTRTGSSRLESANYLDARRRAEPGAALLVARASRSSSTSSGRCSCCSPRWLAPQGPSRGECGSGARSWWRASVARRSRYSRRRRPPRSPPSPTSRRRRASGSSPPAPRSRSQPRTCAGCRRSPPRRAGSRARPLLAAAALRATARRREFPGTAALLPVLGARCS